jgi:hypothetical protein
LKTPQLRLTAAQTFFDFYWKDEIEKIATTKANWEHKQSSKKKSAMEWMNQWIQWNKSEHSVLQHCTITANELLVRLKSPLVKL